MQFGALLTKLTNNAKSREIILLMIFCDLLSNPNPTVFPCEPRKAEYHKVDQRSIDSTDVFDVICNIKDPEHPFTLQQLDIISEDRIEVQKDDGIRCSIRIEFTPTVAHCSLATTIGLCIREKIRKEIPRICKVDIKVTPGSHSSEKEINRQINDKERVAAAMENPFLKPLIEECIQ